MNSGVWILISVLALSSAFGLYRKFSDGRVQSTPTHEHLTALCIENRLGSRATLVQFSSAFCQPCKTTKLLLNDVTENLADVEHIEVDAEGHLDLVRELGIMRTPTTLILDKSGDIVGRAVGVPRREEVIAALAQVR